MRDWILFRVEGGPNTPWLIHLIASAVNLAQFLGLVGLVTMVVRIVWGW